MDVAGQFDRKSLRLFALIIPCFLCANLSIRIFVPRKISLAQSVLYSYLFSSIPQRNKFIIVRYNEYDGM